MKQYKEKDDQLLKNLLFEVFSAGFEAALQDKPLVYAFNIFWEYLEHRE